MLEFWEMAWSNQIKYNEIVRWMLEIEKQTQSEQKENIVLTTNIVKEQAKKVTRILVKYIYKHMISNSLWLAEQNWDFKNLRNTKDQLLIHRTVFRKSLKYVKQTSISLGLIK